MIILAVFADVTLVLLATPAVCLAVHQHVQLDRLANSTLPLTQPANPCVHILWFFFFSFTLWFTTLSGFGGHADVYHAQQPVQQDHLKPPA